MSLVCCEGFWQRHVRLQFVIVMLYLDFGNEPIAYDACDCPSIEIVCGHAEYRVLSDVAFDSEVI